MMFTPKQAADELRATVLSGGWRDVEDLMAAWRSRPGPWIETARETPADRGIDRLDWVRIPTSAKKPQYVRAEDAHRFDFWMPVDNPPLPEPRPEPKSPGDDEMSRIIELANKLTPQQNREMAKYLSGVADLDEERAKRPEPTREQLMRLWEVIDKTVSSAAQRNTRAIRTEIEAERGRG